MNEEISPAHPPPIRFSRCGIFIVVLVAGSFLLAPCAADAQRSALTLPQNLIDLTTKADRIVEGKVLAAWAEPSPEYRNLKTLVVTLEVEDVLKGDSTKNLTFRQFIWDIRDVADVGGYRRGQRVLLFLNRPTPLGLVSPVGLGQGHFRVIRNRNGELAAINDSGNTGLLHRIFEPGGLNSANLSAQSRVALQGFTQGQIPFSALKETILALLQSRGSVK